MLLHEGPFDLVDFLIMLLHGDSKHDDVQAFFLLPLLTFILSYLPKIHDWQCSDLLWDPLAAQGVMDCSAGLIDQFFTA